MARRGPGNLGPNNLPFARFLEQTSDARRLAAAARGYRPESLEKCQQGLRVIGVPAMLLEHRLPPN
jgi:hypothetical protein